MWANLRRIGIFILLLFIAGIFASSFYLFQLAGNLADTPVIDRSELGQIAGVLQPLYLIILVTLVLGLVATLVFLVALRSQEKTTGEVGVAISNTSAKQKGNDEADGDHHDDEAMEALDEYRQLLERDQPGKANLEALLSKVCKHLEASQGAVYLATDFEDKRVIELFASYAFYIAESDTLRFEFGEGLAGQVAKQGKLTNISAVPEGYISILSGLGKATPSHMIFIPIIHEEQLVGVAEIASFNAFGKKEERLLSGVFQLVGAYNDRFQLQLNSQ